MRLETIASDIVDVMRDATEDACRRTALLAAEFAVSSTRLDAKEALEALDAVREGRFGETSERRALEALIVTLDEQQWNLQDAVAANTATDDEHLKAFGLARAASAIFYAGESNSRLAAAEAIYEASALFDDLTELRSLALAALST
jgi:hypothetical protein